MRRNIVGIAAVMLITVMLTACGNADSKVNQIIQSQMQEADNSGRNEDTLVPDGDKTSDVTAESQTEAVVDEGIDSVNEGNEAESNSSVDNTSEGTSYDTVDVDLTLLSSTMVYSEVYNMMYLPEKYVGKTVRMNGMFMVYTNIEGTVFYPAVIIADATACCSQGLEFILEGNPAYPEGYPELEKNVTVVGTFELYEEDGNLFCRLQNARIE